VVVVALTLGVLVALSGWFIVNHRSDDAPQQASMERQAEIMTVVTAHENAVNAFDYDAILATMTSDATWFIAGDPGPSMPAEAYAKVVAGYKATHETFTGDPIFSGDLQVSIPIRQTFPPTLGGVEDVTVDGVCVYTLREVNGQLLIAAKELTRS
jgi:hypothetical protein